MALLEHISHRPGIEHWESGSECEEQGPCPHEVNVRQDRTELKQTETPHV